MNHAERLGSLRRRCAASEGFETLRRIAEDAQELSWVAPQSLRGEIADFIDRLRSKRERLAGATAPKRLRAVQLPSHASAGMTIQTTVGPWTTDEFGNRSRLVWNLADGPVPPSPQIPPP
jgi:hypothetical protein